MLIKLLNFPGSVCTMFLDHMPLDLGASEFSYGNPKLVLEFVLLSIVHPSFQQLFSLKIFENVNSVCNMWLSAIFFTSSVHMSFNMVVILFSTHNSNVASFASNKYLLI